MSRLAQVLAISLLAISCYGYDQTLLLAGYGGAGFKGEMEIMHNNNITYVFEQPELANVSWVQKTHEGLVLAGEFANQIIYLRDNKTLVVQLETLQAPVATVLNRNDEVVAACYGGNRTAGIAVVKNLEKKEHLIPQDWIPAEASPFPTRQDCSHVHFVKNYKDDKILATDLGFDHLYSFDLEGNIEIVHNFTRGVGPRHIDYDSKGYIYVVSEMTPRITKLNQDFVEVGQVDLAKPGNWAGGEIHIDEQDNIFVSNRALDGSNGTIMKFRSETEDGFTLIKQGECGNLPRFFALDEKNHVVVASNQWGKSISIMDYDTLELIETIPVPEMQPCYTLAI